MRRTVLSLFCLTLIISGCKTPDPDSQAAREFATQKIGVCCFIDMKNLDVIPDYKAAKSPDLSGQLAELRRKLAARESENEDLSAQLATLKRVPTAPDLSGQLAQLQNSLSAKERENADLSAQLAALKRIPTAPDLSGQLAQLQNSLSAKEHENAYLSGQFAHLQNSLSAKERENANLSAQLAALKEAPKTPDLSGQVAALKSNLSAKEAENSDLARRLAELQGAQDTHAAELMKILNEKGSVTLRGILFDTGKATIKPESEKDLAAIGEILKNNPTWTLEVQGHTDNVGSNEANLKLSQDRAAAIKDYIVQKYGVAADRLIAKGYGETRPVTHNKTDQARALNRRVDLAKK